MKSAGRHLRSKSRAAACAHSGEERVTAPPPTKLMAVLSWSLLPEHRESEAGSPQVCATNARNQTKGSRRRLSRIPAVARMVEFGHSRAGKTPMDKDGSLTPDAAQRSAAD